MIRTFLKTLHVIVPPQAIQVVLWLPVVVVLSGTCGYMWIEGWSFWRSLFFTLVTLTTVGYGDYGLTEAGERFTAIILIVGIATVTFCFSRVAQWLMSDALNPQRRTRSRAMRQRDHYIICGYGSIGSGVATNLINEGKRVVILDPDPATVEAARELGKIALVGDATDDDVLAEAGIENACAILALTTCDATNIVVTLSARAMRPDVLIVARADDLQTATKLYRAGADHVLTLDTKSSRGISDLLLRPNVTSMFYGAANEAEGVRLTEFQVDHSMARAGETIASFGNANKDLVIIGLKQGADAVRLRPPASTKLKVGDTVLIAGRPNDVLKYETCSIVAGRKSGAA